MSQMLSPLPLGDAKKRYIAGVTLWIVGADKANRVGFSTAVLPA
jgi:hypothetical protein